MSELWIIAEQPQMAAELINGAKEIGKGAPVAAFVAGDESVAKGLIAFGADKAYAMPLPADALWEDYAATLVAKAQAEKPVAILVGATRRGRDLAAQMAALLDIPCISDCKKLSIEGSTVTAGRMMYAGMAMKTMQTNGMVIAIVGAKSFDPAAADASRSGAVAVLAPAAAKAKVTARLPKDVESVNLGDASIVIGVGRGFTEEGELSFAHDLAKVMGAEVACTRPIAEFFKWLPEERYLGISGQVIKPSVYLTAGVSGQAQHMYGVRDSKTIVSVNKDENALMLQMSDYFIVGDLKEVLPAIGKAFAEK